MNFLELAVDQMGTCAETLSLEARFSPPTIGLSTYIQYLHKGAAKGGSVYHCTAGRSTQGRSRFDANEQSNIPMLYLVCLA